MNDKFIIEHIRAGSNNTLIISRDDIEINSMNNFTKHDIIGSLKLTTTGLIPHAHFSQWYLTQIMRLERKLPQILSVRFQNNYHN